MLADVTRVYIAQDRATGEFLANDCTRVRLLRHAARSTSKDALNEAIADACWNGLLEFDDGYDIIQFYVMSSQ